MESNIPKIDKEREEAFWSLIDVLNKTDILPYVMIMGSWAQYLYYNIFKDNFRDNMRTRDIDVLYIQRT